MWLRCEYRAAVVFSRSNNNLLSSRDLHIPCSSISAASKHVTEISGTKHKVPKVVIIAEADISIVRLVAELFMTDLSLEAGLMSRDLMQSHVKNHKSD